MASVTTSQLTRTGYVDAAGEARWRIYHTDLALRQKKKLECSQAPRSQPV